MVNQYSISFHEDLGLVGSYGYNIIRSEPDGSFVTIETKEGLSRDEFYKARAEKSQLVNSAVIREVVREVFEKAGWRS